MARISVSKPYTMPREEVMSSAEKLGQWLKEEHNISYQWRDNVADIRCRVKGISGTLTVNPDKIDVNLSLGLFASVFERVLRDEINKYFKENVY